MFRWTARKQIYIFKLHCELTQPWNSRSRDPPGEHPAPRPVQRPVWTGTGLHLPEQRLSTHGDWRMRAQTSTSTSTSQRRPSKIILLFPDGWNWSHRLQHLQRRSRRRRVLLPLLRLLETHHGTLGGQWCPHASGCKEEGLFCPRVVSNLRSFSSRQRSSRVTFFLAGNGVKNVRVAVLAKTPLFVFCWLQTFMRKFLFVFINSTKYNNQYLTPNKQKEVWERPGTSKV